MVRDIPVGDVELGNDDERIEVLAYNVELNDNEKEYFKLPNSATDFVKIDVGKVKTGIQVKAAKHRMSLNVEQDKSSQRMEKDENKIAGTKVYKNQVRPGTRPSH